MPLEASSWAPSYSSMSGSTTSLPNNLPYTPTANTIYNLHHDINDPSMKENTLVIGLKRYPICSFRLEETSRKYYGNITVQSKEEFALLRYGDQPLGIAQWSIESPHLDIQLSEIYVYKVNNREKNIYNLSFSVQNYQSCEPLQRQRERVTENIEVIFSSLSRAEKDKLIEEALST